MNFDEQTVSLFLLKKDGRKYNLTTKGEALVRAGLGDKVPSDAKLAVESTDDGIRVIATFGSVEVTT